MRLGEGKEREWELELVSKIKEDRLFCFEINKLIKNKRIYFEQKG